MMVDKPWTNSTWLYKNCMLPREALHADLLDFKELVIKAVNVVNLQIWPFFTPSASAGK